MHLRATKRKVTERAALQRIARHRKAKRPAHQGELSGGLSIERIEMKGIEANCSAKQGTEALSTEL